MSIYSKNSNFSQWGTIILALKEDGIEIDKNI